MDANGNELTPRLQPNSSKHSRSNWLTYVGRSEKPTQTTNAYELRSKRGNVAVEVQQSHVDGLTNLISEHMLARPACAEFLPDDPEVRAWQKRYDDLQERRNLAIARREELRAEIPPALEAAKYEGNFGVIANLQRMESNLTRKLRGERIGATPDGGVYRVL